MPSEELLRKIEELEEGQAVLKREMTKLLLGRGRADVAGPPRSPHQRSHSVSPQRSRFASAAAAGRAARAARSSPTKWRSVGFDSAWGRGSSSFRQASSLQRESRTPGEPPSAPAQLSDKQYWNILQSMGQAVHILDLEGRIIYWLDFS